jgi:outer membrane receptor for monomeric catechols
MPASKNNNSHFGGTMSRQEKRANERRRSKILHKIALAAGEGVGRAVAFTFALATNAFAAEPEPKKEDTFTLPQVTVTDKTNPYVVPNLGLQRLPEPVQNIPQSITIVPQQIIQEQAATTLRDALRNVTGIGIAAGEGGGAQGDNFTLRGFNVRNDMYLDGVRDQGTYFRDTFNIESVEVLKGPASAPTFPPPCFSAIPQTTTVANWSLMTSTAPIPRSYRQAT